MNIILEEYKGTNRNIYRALEDGIYNGITKDIKITTSKSGKHMIVVEVELQGEKMLNGAHLGGRIERYYIILNDKFSGTKLFGLLQAVGVDVKAGDEINVEQIICSNVMTNKNVLVVLKKTSYKNKDGEIVECNRIAYLKKCNNVNNNNNSIEINDDDIPF